MSFTTDSVTNNLFLINDIASPSSSAGSPASLDPLRRFIHDAVAIGVSYFLTFLACDFIQFDYNIKSAIEHLPLYILGPYLFIFPFAYKRLKSFLKKQIEKLIASIEGSIHFPW